MKLNVFLDARPLETGHNNRGIGRYTRSLIAGLKQHPDVSLVSRQEADIIHYPYFDLFWPSLPLKLEFSKKVVVTIHDVIPLELPNMYPVGLRGKYSFWRQKQCLRLTDHVISDSLASKQAIVNYLNVPEANITPIYLAADQDFQPQSSQELATIKARFHLPERYVLYVGDINPNKNIPELIRILNFLPDDISLVCVGKNFYQQDIPEWQAIEAAINQLDNPRVTFLTKIGSNQTSQLAAIYQQALCYVQPSLIEGFGLPVLEALQSGTVVVSTRGGSLPEVGGQVVAYADFSAQSLATQVRKIADLTASQRKKRIDQGRAWAKTFDWQKTVEQVVEVYQACLV